jgi:hypothetical protein
VHPIEGERPDLSADLAILDQHDLTRLETPEPDLAHLFKHVITQESAYNLLPFAPSVGSCTAPSPAGSNAARPATLRRTIRCWRTTGAGPR